MHPVDLDPRLQKKLNRSGPAELVMSCTWAGKPAAVAFGADRVTLVGTGFGSEITAPFAASKVVDSNGFNRVLRCFGMEETIVFADSTVATRFDQALEQRRATVVTRPAQLVEPLNAEFVVTLAQVPGYAIVRVLGAVSELSATSGFTASSKGNSALEQAMTQLRRSAAELHANAIVGLTSCAFGAAGGITSAFGGDAVGVLLVGTAVVVEPIVEPALPAKPGNAGLPG